MHVKMLLNLIWSCDVRLWFIYLFGREQWDAYFLEEPHQRIMTDLDVLRLHRRSKSEKFTSQRFRQYTPYLDKFIQSDAQKLKLFIAAGNNDQGYLFYFIGSRVRVHAFYYTDEGQQLHNEQFISYDDWASHLKRNSIPNIVGVGAPMRWLLFELI